MLAVRDLAVRYGPIQAVRGIDLDVAAGEIVALVGANGAGKTSAVKAVAGLVPFTGEVAYDGRALRPGQAERNLRAGLALVPEGRGILGRMTVEENLLMGTYARRDRTQAAADLAAMLGRFPILGERLRMRAGLLSGGEQQMLAIARALLSRPRLLLLDEPSLGLAPKLVRRIFDLIAEIRARGVPILLVEQNARAALAVADRGYVLEGGRVALAGPARQLAADPRILEAYLGGHVH